MDNAPDHRQSGTANPIPNANEGRGGNARTDRNQTRSHPDRHPTNGWTCADGAETKGRHRRSTNRPSRRRESGALYGEACYPRRPCYLAATDGASDVSRLVDRSESGGVHSPPGIKRVIRNQRSGAWGVYQRRLPERRIRRAFPSSTSQMKSQRPYRPSSDCMVRPRLGELINYRAGATSPRRRRGRVGRTIFRLAVDTAISD